MQEPLLTPKAIDPLFESIKALKGWAFFRLAPLLADNTFYQEVFTSAEKHGMTVMRMPYSIGYTIRTNMGWNEYEGSRSKKFKKMLRAAENKMQKSGGFRIEAHTDAGSADKLLDMLRAITMKSWKVEAGSDLFNQAYQGFWEMAFLKTIAAGQATLWILYHEEHPIGYEWSLRQGGRVIALKADYDKDYSIFSPGNVLAWHILKHFFANGASEIDYGMGGDYKKGGPPTATSLKNY